MRRRRGGVGRFQAVVGPQVALQERVFPNECARRHLPSSCGWFTYRELHKLICGVQLQLHVPVRPGSGAYATCVLLDHPWPVVGTGGTGCVAFPTL